MITKEIQSTLLIMLNIHIYNIYKPNNNNNEMKTPKHDFYQTGNWRIKQIQLKSLKYTKYEIYCLPKILWKQLQMIS